MSYWKALQSLAEQLSVDWTDIARKLSVFMQEAATSMVNSGIGAVTNIIGAIVNFFIGFVFAVYLLMAKEKLAGQGKQILFAVFKGRHSGENSLCLQPCQQNFSKFISGQCLEACILGMMFSLP